ncbi:unnamed protein product [Rhizophagus irregularis]|uniref:Uncharacterized protein n=3 Tax=Rhizophagus irregularis TaxID=588596 RepID=U9TIY1_RHIID|nr:hypothetical protein GLOIN_2v1480352 [Rhizophagus irregularis DAOM 181602=DAOM 197198]EXX73246.1 hypothetical protein RirG_061820 [Rhizophagus irregularis DAOM 197198w]PKC69237.1 hypothetical protein RhiirA1_440130 [Rhizophagus irregularis]PKY12631.1 hypothetical protein RhiirB3_510238 [Rhizophagus irregularis]PKY48609.1 hypothetical protein RhiirA4_525609 [Rhizophagus irregularis]POG69027.1 hypothetical protein GLOIN_2v1480352 [Rhizophagus irregularis DAOM 181602=DAOM 197198]|eukprot:XP_025175893.1 hypothetical protein GLOIN_2v1480352 [Rhizophagus irregularis DAOM 181602=DAOM 197198]
MSVLPTGNNHSRIIVLKDFIKELDLTEEEREAFRKARSQVQTHSRLGALAGALAGGYFSKIKKFTLGISLAICMGTITLGSQIGFFTGTAAGLRTIKSLPNSQRIFEAIKDAHFRKIAQNKKQSQNQNQEQGEDVDSSALSDEFTPDGRNLGDTADEQSSWAKYRPTPTPSRQQQSSSPQHDDNNSSWDKIRANNPSSTWDKIRQNNTSEQQQQNPTFNNESSNESIPRTREDFEELRNEGKIRTNQYGDIEIIN